MLIVLDFEKYHMTRTEIQLKYVGDKRVPTTEHAERSGNGPDECVSYSIT